jgi:hypothetical protein
VAFLSEGESGKYSNPSIANNVLTGESRPFAHRVVGSKAWSGSSGRERSENHKSPYGDAVMALLYRFAQLPDRSGTRVFSFVVTRSVVRDPERDVTSKELVCGFQKWAVAFSRGDKVRFSPPSFILCFNFGNICPSFGNALYFFFFNYYFN